jgi:hypothetical protein
LKRQKAFQSSVVIIQIMLENPRDMTTTEAVETAFALKLHVVLDASARQGFDDVVSWQGNNAFMVHKPKKFEDSIMKEYFNQTQYRSFQKQRELQSFSPNQSDFSAGHYLLLPRILPIFLSNKSILSSLAIIRGTN